jgi:hypothetical protein
MFLPHTKIIRFTSIQLQNSCYFHTLIFNVSELDVMRHKTLFKNTFKEYCSCISFSEAVFGTWEYERAYMKF